MKFRNLYFLLMLLALTTILVACNFGNDEKEDADQKEGDSEEQVKDEPKEINLVITSEPPSLHPQLATDTTSGSILENVFEGLTSVKDGEVQNAAASDVKVSDDLLTYTFTLRDAKWSNGDSVTAEDFAYAWKFALNAKNESEYASILFPIKNAEKYFNGEAKEDELGIKVVDEKTLEVTLENPTPYFLELTAFKTYYPIHKATAEANAKWYTEGGAGYVSNGAYTLSEWSHDATITLEKSASYWDAANVSIDKVNFTMVESEGTQVTMFDNGDIDYLGVPFGTVGLDAIDRYKSEGILNITEYSGVYMYKFNTTDKIMSNVNIRKALTLAINRADLIANITKGEQQPGVAIVPSGVKGFEEDMGYFKDNDIEGAKEALKKGMEELGIKDASEIKLNLSFNTSDAHQVIAQYIQEGWRKALGIEVTLDNSEWQVYLDKLDKLDYQIGRLGWIADYNDAYTFLEIYNSAENGNNDTGWENAEYTALLEKSNVESDPEKRIALLKEAEAIFMSEFAVAPIYYYTNLSVKKDYLEGMEPDKLGNLNLKYVDIKK